MKRLVQLLHQPNITQEDEDFVIKTFLQDP